MNMRFITFAFAAAVWICFAAPQLKADEPVQPNGIPQSVGEAVAGGGIEAERTDIAAWMICEGWMPYGEAIAVDDVIEQAVAEKPEPQEVEATLAEDDDEIACANESVEAEAVSITEEPLVDDLLESEAVVSEETEQVGVEAEEVLGDAITEVIETTEDTFVETITEEDLVEEFRCVEGFDGWIVERDFETEGLIEEKDNSLESDAVVGEETVQVAVADAVQTFEEAATDESETPEVENFVNEDLTGGSIWIAVFDANFDEGGFAADEFTQEETIVEETLEVIESAEVEGNVEIAESAVEEAVLDNATNNVEAEESAVAQISEKVAINGDLTLDTEHISEVSVDLEASAAELTEESPEQKIEEEFTVEEAINVAEAIEVDRDVEILETATEIATAVETAEVLETENALDAVAPTIEEEAVVEESTVVTDEIASLVAVEAFDDERIEQIAVEDVSSPIATYEDLATDGVVDDEETLVAGEQLIEVIEPQELEESESVTTDNVNEPEAGTVRTFEFNGCKITITSERRMDDFELLNMLWDTVDQLEAELD